MNELTAQLRAMVGTEGRPQKARDPVNQPMIRHWCDAMTDHNPVYVDADAAGKSVHGQIVAPPTMLNAWNMLGNVPRPRDSDDPFSGSLNLLDDAGYTSVVATNSEHEYTRYLRLGDELTGTIRLVDVSDEKETALGIGHFVTTQTHYTNQDGDPLGSMLFRILKFRPGTGRIPEGAAALAAPAPPRPRPGAIYETRFFWDGLREGELRIQSCEGCGALRHPPVVRCPQCGSYELGHRVASGRGHLYSFVEVHHPQVPGFDYPLVVALVELEEGTRLLCNLEAIGPDPLEVGMPLEMVVRDLDPELSLPFFQPLRPPRREQTLRYEEVEVGDELAPCPVPITRTLIVSAAIASRDYQDVHHDAVLARKRSSPDIFMNILSTGGLCGRYVTDWAGPEALMQNLKIRLGVPNYPDDTMRFSGRVEAKEQRDGRAIVRVALRGSNRLGDHVTGTTELVLPSGGGAS